MRQHLKNVYGTLTMTCAAASAGVYVDMYTRFQAGLLSAIVGAGLMLMLIATPENGKNTSLRLGYLLGFGLTSGRHEFLHHLPTIPTMFFFKKSTLKNARAAAHTAMLQSVPRKHKPTHAHITESKEHYYSWTSYHV